MFFFLMVTVWYIHYIIYVHAYNRKNLGIRDCTQNPILRMRKRNPPSYSRDWILRVNMWVANPQKLPGSVSEFPRKNGCCFSGCFCWDLLTWSAGDHGTHWLLIGMWSCPGVEVPGDSRFGWVKRKWRTPYEKNKFLMSFDGTYYDRIKIRKVLKEWYDDDHYNNFHHCHDYQSYDSLYYHVYHNYSYQSQYHQHYYVITRWPLTGYTCGHSSPNKMAEHKWGNWGYVTVTLLLEVISLHLSLFFGTTL